MGEEAKKKKEEEDRKEMERQKKAEKDRAKVCKCSGHGSCVDSKPPCVCTDNYFGENCEHSPVRIEENIPDGVDPAMFRALPPNIQEKMREEHRKKVADEVVSEATNEGKEEYVKTKELIEEEGEKKKDLNISEVKKKVPVPPGVDPDKFSTLPFSIRKQMWEDHLKSENLKERNTARISNRLNRIKEMKALLEKETIEFEKAL